MDGGDSVTVRRAAHTLKSNAATFGLVELTPLCRELENSASNGDLMDAGELVESIDHALADGRAALLVVAAAAAG
jgi:HPt (histidine-containing phosphotransfer) domain-containing protein